MRNEYSNNVWKKISRIEFKFIYDIHKNNKDTECKNKDLYTHIYIAKCKIKLINNSIIEIHGYNSVGKIEVLNIMAK